MKKKKNQISSLLAARSGALRRRPPVPAPAPEHAGRLKLVRDEIRPQEMGPTDTGVGAAWDRDIAATPVVGQASDAVSGPPAESAYVARTAATALTGIHALLMDALDRLDQGSRPRRRSPREICEVQALIDRTVRDIDRIVDSATISGRKLLDGAFRFMLLAEPGCPARRVAVRSMQPGHLGPDAVRCLSSLRSGGCCSLMITSFEEAATILRHAVGQVAMERRQVVPVSSLDERGDSACPEISDENASAARSANLDLDFASLTSELTPGVALASAQSSRGGPPDPDVRPNLTIRRS